MIAYCAGRLGPGPMGARLFRAWIRWTDGSPGIALGFPRVKIAARCLCLMNEWGKVVSPCTAHSGER